MNKFGPVQNRISKTSKNSLQQAKNQISFSNRTFKSTAVSNRRINSTSDDQSARTQVPFSKMSERSSSNFETKITFENFLPPYFTFKFFLFHVKLDLIVLARSKTTIKNKSASIGLRRKRKILTENVNRFAKSNRKRAFTPGNQLPKINKVRKSQTHICKHLNIRRAIPKTKIHSVKIVHFMTLSFSGRIASNTIHYIL